jgi:uncharacterized protein (TIGR00299 family) protein
MTILVYDCFSGISGDMNLGAMIDLGVDPDWLRNELMKLKLPGWELKAEKDQRHGITGTKVTVIQTREEHLHRHLSDIVKIITESTLPPEVTGMAIKIFTIIAEAEASVHDVPVDKIHFHEVGAIDAIIDIVGAALCYDFFRPDAVIYSSIELGGGLVRCAHGTLPVPAPATARIVKNMKIRLNGVDFEATTPTGAAILSAFTEKNLADNLQLKFIKTGYGVGHKKHPDVPNMLRVTLAETTETTEQRHEALLIECNIDDMNPELYDHITEKLFVAGAADVYLNNIIMKKGRPGIILSVICEKGRESAIRETIFTETTTIGIRTTSFMKSTLDRKTVSLETEFGKVSFKFSYMNNRLVSAKPEADECRDIALKSGLPLKEIITKLSRYPFESQI